MNRTGRLHVPHVRALADPAAAQTVLRAPMPGHFVPLIDRGDLVSPDEVIGQLVVLGRPLALLAGNVAGLAVEPGGPRMVAYGDRLVALDRELTHAATTAPAVTDATAAAAAGGGQRVFRAPTSGRFYGRPAPDKPPFVTAGSTLAPGTTICLLEVMKTFHRVTYPDDPARVKAVLVADGDDVNAGDPLLALE